MKIWNVNEFEDEEEAWKLAPNDVVILDTGAHGTYYGPDWYGKQAPPGKVWVEMEGDIAIVDPDEISQLASKKEGRGMRTEAVEGIEWKECPECGLEIQWLYGKEIRQDHAVGCSRKVSRGAAMRTEAEIIKDLGRATGAQEQQELVRELEAFRHARTAAVRADRDVDISNTFIRDTLTPVIPYQKHSADTDWIEAEASSGEYDHPMRVEATMWFKRVSPEVKADREEFAEQAQGMARRVSGQFGLQAEAAYHAFLETVARLYKQGETGASDEESEVLPTGPEMKLPSRENYSAGYARGVQDAASGSPYDAADLPVDQLSGYYDGYDALKSKLGGGRRTADDKPGEVDEDQSGNAESAVTDYDTDADQEPFLAEDWEDEGDTGVHPPMPGAGEDVGSGEGPNAGKDFQARRRARRRTASRKQAASSTWLKDAPNAQPKGGLVGYVTATYGELVEKYGQPYGPSPDDKVQVQWILQDRPGGTIVSIYDWKKYGEDPEKNTDWNIGGSRTGLLLVQQDFPNAHSSTTGSKKAGGSGKGRGGAAAPSRGGTHKTAQGPEFEGWQLSEDMDGGDIWVNLSVMDEYDYTLLAYKTDTGEGPWGWSLVVGEAQREEAEGTAPTRVKAQDAAFAAAQAHAGTTASRRKTAADKYYPAGNAPRFESDNPYDCANCGHSLEDHSGQPRELGAWTKDDMTACRYEDCRGYATSPSIAEMDRGDLLGSRKTADYEVYEFDGWQWHQCAGEAEARMVAADMEEELDLHATVAFRPNLGGWGVMTTKQFDPLPGADSWTQTIGSRKTAVNNYDLLPDQMGMFDEIDAGVAAAIRDAPITVPALWDYADEQAATIGGMETDTAVREAIWTAIVSSVDPSLVVNLSQRDELLAGGPDLFGNFAKRKTGADIPAGSFELNDGSGRIVHNEYYDEHADCKAEWKETHPGGVQGYWPTGAKQREVEDSTQGPGSYQGEGGKWFHAEWYDEHADCKGEWKPTHPGGEQAWFSAGSPTRIVETSTGDVVKQYGGPTARRKARRKTAALTADDVEAGLRNEWHGGYGYAGLRSSAPPAFNVKVDVLVAWAANKLGWNADQLFLWLNSRGARHAVDELVGAEDSELETILLKYMTAESMTTLEAEEAGVDAEYAEMQKLNPGWTEKRPPGAPANFARLYH